MQLFARLLNPLLMMALPLLLGAFLTRRLRVDWHLFGVGALAFLGAQTLHLPFNLWLLGPALDALGLGSSSAGWEWALVAVIAGLSAGFFEESARYLVYRRWPRDGLVWRNALMLGAGHGGMESLLLGGLALYGFWQALALQGVDLNPVVSPDRLELLEAQLAAYWGTPWQLALLGAVERAAVLCVHLSLSVLVLQAVARRNLRWLALAVGWHALVNGVALIVLRASGVSWTEGTLAGLALVSLAMMFGLRAADPLADTRVEPAVSSPDVERPQPTLEQLEDSRYVQR